uniref:Venom metalloproteinase (Fragments) n=2 Tax=Tityus TaxID=6886 RepID=VMXP_TITSE|nr:RecName: Full=Venom metalloproteinase; Short=VMP [Tityus serrulatus]
SPCIIIDYLCVTETCFCERFKTNKELLEYITVMFTGVQNLLDTLNLGIVGVAQDYSDYNERVDTVAHETAHLIGAPHDEEGPCQDT